MGNAAVKWLALSEIINQIIHIHKFKFLSVMEYSVRLAVANAPTLFYLARLFVFGLRLRAYSVARTKLLTSVHIIVACRSFEFELTQESG